MRNGSLESGRKHEVLLVSEANSGPVGGATRSELMGVGPYSCHRPFCNFMGAAGGRKRRTPIFEPV
jgi:hypothetical protein